MGTATRFFSSSLDARSNLGTGLTSSQAGGAIFFGEKETGNYMEL